MGGLGSHLEGVVLFGSLARGEAGEKSDIDLFVVTKNLEGSDRERLRTVYGALRPLLRRFGRGISLIERRAEELPPKTDLTPLLINVAWEGVILYDREGLIAKLLAGIRRAVRRAGLIRYRTRDGKYGWRLRRPLRRGETFTIQLGVEFG